MVFDEATEVSYAEHADVVVVNVNVGYRSALNLASYEKMGEETDSETARPAGREDVVAAQAEDMAGNMKTGKERDPKTACPAGSMLTTARGGRFRRPHHAVACWWSTGAHCRVGAHAAEEEWLAQYLIKRDRTPEVSIVSPLLSTYSIFLHVLKSRYIYLCLFLLRVHVSGTIFLSVGGLRRGAKHF